MALTNINDITIESLHRSGHGVRASEAIVFKDGNSKKRYWTLWFNEPSNLTVGEIVNVSGFLDCSVSDPFTGSDGNEYRAVNYNLQSPRVNERKQSAAPAAEPANDGWATTPVATPVSGDEPF